MPSSVFSLRAAVISAATVVGRKEHEGPLGAHFDFFSQSDRFGQATWEGAEAEMQRMALSAALGKLDMQPKDVQLLFAGDLQNQCVGSAYGLLSYDIPYFGLYGACSTCAESLLLAAAMISAGFTETAAAVTSSHNAVAERQFRFPVEYGGQRPPTGQWTVTGAGGFILRQAEASIYPPMAYVTAGMPGMVLDAGINDANNMGAAMAPSAADTLLRYFKESETSAEDYDLIVTGDLGWEGGSILCDLMNSEGYPIETNYQDCGRLIFSKNTQDTHGGGSGCGCSAVVLGSYLLPRLMRGKIKKMLFMATGALMSPDSLKQGNAIPGVGHLLCLESPCH
ncbi:MAG: stage V sporulation protein AD [Ruminococcaceae bacterium]|nr:stage V sporulation protein AD [Oscillospiraceae bacterium]